MDVWQDLDNRLRAQAANDDVSGSVLLTRAGHTIFHGCYGLADRAAGVPIGPGTRFGLASVTKMFTAAAVADQISAGRLALGSRIVDLLPAQARPTTLHPDVTVAHLLLHTSGIADYAEEDDTFPSYLDDYASLWQDRPSYRMLRPRTSCRSSPTCRPTGRRASPGSTATRATSCSGSSSNTSPAGHTSTWSKTASSTAPA